MRGEARHGEGAVREAAAARAPQDSWNPYLAGLGLEFVLLAAFVIMGRGLGRPERPLP
jgi:hypothetical protein